MTDSSTERVIPARLLGYVGTSKKDAPSMPVSSPEQTRAAQIGQTLNPNILVAAEDEHVILIEDHWDSPSDHRMYRLEYRCTADGDRAIAFCLFNPWATDGNSPNAGRTASRGHVFSDGCLCLGSSHTRTVSESEYDLETVIKRSRYWCTGFSVLMETGKFPDL